MMVNQLYSMVHRDLPSTSANFWAVVPTEREFQDFASSAYTQF